MKKLYVRTAYFYLMLIALLGIVLRMMSVTGLPINYKNLLHTHSHLAFLGWVYTAFFALYIELFSSKSSTQVKKYRIQFYLTQCVNIGILFSFPFQGYGVISIVFSTLHILLSYLFVYTLYKDMKTNDAISSFSRKLAHYAFVFLILSSLGPFVLPVMIKWYGNGSSNYYNAIYYYLHFQYNGWFTFSVIAFCFRFFELKGKWLDAAIFGRLSDWLFISIFFTLFLSFLWDRPSMHFYIIAAIGAAIQLLVSIVAMHYIKKGYYFKHSFANPFLRRLFFTIIFCVVLKLFFQCFGTIPYVADLVYDYRSFIIAYLHLFLIGVISCSVLLMSIELGYLQLTPLLNKACNLFIAGFVLTEIVMFAQGTTAWLEIRTKLDLNLILFIVSCTFPLSALIFWLKSK